MDVEKAKAVAYRFNDFINARDIEGLSQMMTDDHVFIDSTDSRVSGRRACIRAWESFFAAFPDYRNDITRILTQDALVVLVGRSSCSDRRLDGPALWTAKVRGDRVSEWRVFEDTECNRSKLGLSV